ncbi:MAG: transglycosylase SLT domain-containing protein [Methylococcales bacterium]
MYRSYYLRITFFLSLSILAWLPVSSFAFNHLRANSASTESDVFPDPPGLRDAVQFWRQVFGVWRGNQVTLHDNEYLGAVYEVIHLPSSWREELSSGQKEYIQDRREALEKKLEALENRLRYGLSLNTELQGLHDVIVRAAGKFAVYGAARRVRQQRGMRERFLEGLQTSGRYDTHMREVFRNARLPEDLAYLPHIESSFVNHSRSQAGAAGVWQFMRSTGALYMMINEAVDERFDPVFAARGAARYLGGAYQRLGDWGLAITSYNHGINGMAAARDQYGRDIEKIVRNYKGRLFGFASRNFYAEFLAVRSIIGDLNKYFPGGVRLDPPIDRARVRLMYPATLAQLANDYGIGTGFVQALNPALTQPVINGRIALPAGTELWLPEHTVANRGSVTVNTRKYGTSPLEKPIFKPVFRALRNTAPNKPVRVTASRPSPVKKTASRKSKFHLVRKGESPYGIASRYGVQVGTMMAFNDLRPDDVIRPGQQLRIPMK